MMMSRSSKINSTMIMVAVVLFMCFVSSSIDGLRLTGKPVWPAKYKVGEVFESVTTRNAWEGNRRTSTSWLSRHKVKDHSSKTSESNEVSQETILWLIDEVVNLWLVDAMLSLTDEDSKWNYIWNYRQSLSPWDDMKALYKNRSMKYRAGEALESAGGHTLAALFAAPTLVGAVPYKLHQMMKFIMMTSSNFDEVEKLKTLYQQCNRDHMNPALSKWCVILKEAYVMSPLGSKEAKEQVRKDRENSRRRKAFAYSMRMVGKK